jgi:hypothetical protein
VNGWRGRIAINDRLNNLFVTAINSDDLTVRAAGIEIDVAARNLTKDSSTIDRLEPIARFGEQGPRVNACGTWRSSATGESTRITSRTFFSFPFTMKT